MPRGGTGGVKNFSVGICDGAPSTARSSLKVEREVELRILRGISFHSLIYDGKNDL